MGHHHLPYLSYGLQGLSTVWQLWFSSIYTDIYTPSLTSVLMQIVRVLYLFLRFENRLTYFWLVWTAFCAMNELGCSLNIVRDDTLMWYGHMLGSLRHERGRDNSLDKKPNATESVILI